MIHRLLGATTYRATLLGGRGNLAAAEEGGALSEAAKLQVRSAAAASRFPRGVRRADPPDQARDGVTPRSEVQT